MSRALAGSLTAPGGVNTSMGAPIPAETMTRQRTASWSSTPAPHWTTWTTWNNVVHRRMLVWTLFVKMKLVQTLQVTVLKLLPRCGAAQGPWSQCLMDRSQFRKVNSSETGDAVPHRAVNMRLPPDCALNYRKVVSRYEALLSAQKEWQ